MISYIQ